MTPQTQLMLVRLATVALILGAFSLSATVLKGTEAASIVPSITTLLFGWLGLGSPLKEAVLKDELKKLSLAPPTNEVQ